MPTQKKSGYGERIATDPAILRGKPAIRGTRIAVEHVLQQLADEPNFNELFEAYPDLTIEDVIAALDYARAVLAREVVLPRLATSYHTAASA